MSALAMLADEWFQKAREALGYARVGFAGNGAPGFTCFLAHQAGELALKGFLKSRAHKPPRIHDLGRLVELCKLSDPTFPGQSSDAAVLDPWYIPGRYPSPLLVGATVADAAIALDAAARVVAAAAGSGPEP